MELGRAVLRLVAQLCPTLCDPMYCSPPGSSVHGDSPGKNIGVDCHTLLQRIFPTQGSNPGLPHCRQIPYRLSHPGRLWILEWVAYCFSSRPSRSRNQTRVSCIADRFFTSWATRETPQKPCQNLYYLTVCWSRLEILESSYLEWNLVYNTWDLRKV